MNSATRRGRGRRLAIVLVALASAGMLLLGACGGGDKKTDDTKPASPASTGGSGTSGGEVVKIKVKEYAIETPKTSFTAGKAYDLKVDNVGTMEHNLFVFVKGDRDESKAIAKIPTAQLPPGKSASTTMTLPSAGDYEFVCTVPGHEQLGMKVEIKATA